MEKKKSEGISLTLKMDDEAVAMFKSGEARHLQMTIDDDNKKDLLENIQGHLILATDEMPMKYHGCYFWNNGVFPYVIKKDLKYFVVTDGKYQCRLKIISYVTSVGQRFIFGEPGKPSVSDVRGDSCYWIVTFQVEAVDDNGEPLKHKTYLLRWNPTISSFELGDYRNAIKQYPDGFTLNWSVYEWEEAHRGDRFYMLRTGDDMAGIVFRGIFTSEPYPGDDWAGKGRQRYYMGMECYECVPADQLPPVSVEILEDTIPDINWRRGHSGQLLSDEDTEKLEKLWKDKV